MKTLKVFLFILLGAVALILIVAAFLPSERSFSQSIEIERTPRVIFSQINSLQNWEPWSPFQEEDPNMTSEFFGPESGVGNRQVWKSKKQGDGNMEIIESINEHKVVFALDLGSGSVNETLFILERGKDNVVVTWETTIKGLGYPFWRILMTIFSSSMEKTFKRGLENLKIHVEALPIDCKSGDVEVVEIPSRNVLAISGRATSETIEAFLGQAYGNLFAAIAANKLQLVGPPFAIYEGDETTIEWGLTAALPVKRLPAKLPDGIQKIALPATKAVAIMHSGAYQTANDSYYKILDFIAENNFQISGDSWEEYITDPAEVTDPLQIQTKIFFPVK